MTDNVGVTWTKDGTLNHLGRPSWLVDAYLQTLMQAFEDAGRQIYAVGGCVRDTALEYETDGAFHSSVKDVDLSTDAHPDETTRIIENLTTGDTPWKAVPTGIDHGTVTAVVAGRAYEITTFRKDVETDGRHAVVAFSKNMIDDAMRRDFTINAFYADRSGNVRDIVGGSADLRERRIRFIGDPSERIQEDYLRILRFFRFTASHGMRSDGIDPDGLAACAMFADGLDGVSRERIGAEFTRIIGGFDPAPIIGTMEVSGVLMRILPGARVSTLARLIDLEEAYPNEGLMPLPVNMPTRLASLGCEDVVDRLRLSNAQSDKIALVLKEAGSVTPPHELGYRHGYWPAVQCLLLRWATLLQPFDVAAIDKIHLGADATFPITAADLMPVFTGKALGDRLRTLETAWIASEFQLSKLQLLALK